MVGEMPLQFGSGGTRRKIASLFASFSRRTMRMRPARDDKRRMCEKVLKAFTVFRRFGTSDGAWLAVAKREDNFLGFRCFLTRGLPKEKLIYLKFSCSMDTKQDGGRGFRLEDRRPPRLLN